MSKPNEEKIPTPAGIVPKDGRTEGKPEKGNRGTKPKGKPSKRKPFSNGKSGDGGEHGVEYMPKRNDPCFYTKYKSLSDTFARVAFNHRNGSKLYCNPNTYCQVNWNVDPITVIDYIPTPGKSTDMQSGINVAALNEYKVLNRRYRGSMTSKYESADLGLAQFAIVDFYASLAQAERAYGIAQVAKVNQRQLPREMLFALGYDADEFMTHLADFRSSLNYLIIRAQGLCLVKGYSLLDHHLFLLSNIFKDKDTARGQYFAYKKPGFWKWNPTITATGSALEWVDYRNTNHHMKVGNGYYAMHTTTEVVLQLNAQLDALLGDSDIDNICADILAFFGNENNSPNLVKLVSIPEAYAVEAIYDENVLKQFHNTTVPIGVPQYATSSSAVAGPKVGDTIRSPIPADIIPTGSTISDFHTPLIYQKNNTIICFFESFGGGNAEWKLFSDTYHYVTVGTADQSKILKEAILDTDALEPSPENVMEWTRNMVLTDQASYTADAQTYYFSEAYRAFGSVLPIGITPFLFKEVGVNPRDSSGNIVFTANQAARVQLGSFVGSTSIDISNLLKFDWCPILYTADHRIVGDLDNYIVVDVKLLEPIHSVAVLSEFHNPISDIVLKDA